MKILKDKFYHFWVDYIEIYWTLKKLNEINYWVSEFWLEITNKKTLFPWFEFRKETKIINYTYKIVISYNWIDCFAYHIWKENGVIKTQDYLAVYWTAFAILPLPKIIDFIKTELDFTKLRRFDLALDILEDIRKIHKCFNKKKCKWSIFLNNNWETQTFYIWEKKKEFNRYKLLRVYNKKDDILRLWRQKLFPDYLKQKFITRLEIEIRVELAQNCHLEQLLDEKYIFNLFLTYISDYTDIFNNIEYEKIKLNRIHKEVDFESLKYSELLRDRYLGNFLWYSRNILTLWWCPVDILLRENVVDEWTKKDIVSAIRNWEFNQEFYSWGLTTRNIKNIFYNYNDYDE